MKQVLIVAPAAAHKEYRKYYEPIADVVETTGGLLSRVVIGATIIRFVTPHLEKIQGYQPDRILLDESPVRELPEGILNEAYMRVVPQQGQVWGTMNGRLR